MDCARARSLLHPWLDGELEREDHRAVVEHLTHCEQCDARYRDEQRLLGRVKAGLHTPCPAELRAKLVASFTAGGFAAPRPTLRAGIITLRSAAAAAAVFVVAFVWSDPICLRGCPTVRALVQDHHAASPAIITTSNEVAAAAARKMIGERVTECEDVCGCECVGLECLGVKPLACTTKGCMILYRDRGGRSISFVKLKGTHLHAWLRFRAGADGLMATSQDGCRFLAWRDQDGDTCGLVADESVLPTELVAISERVRGH